MLKLKSLLFNTTKNAKKEILANVAKSNIPKPIFFPLSESPLTHLNKYHQDICEYGSCPTCISINHILPSDTDTDTDSTDISNRSKPLPKSINRPTSFCQKCGFPIHCSDHWQQTTEDHECSLLRQWIEDEHDLLYSGRKLWEINFPGRQQRDAILNFTSWPYLFVTRKFPKQLFSSPMAQRHISRLLTYPYTIASVLQNPWVYSQITVTDPGWHLLSKLSHAIDTGCRAALKGLFMFASL
jgi:hypothetical protein